MKKRCDKIEVQLDRWLELTDEQKQSIRSHAYDCRSCEKALRESEQALGVLEQSAVEYGRIKYSGSMPPLPEKRLAWWWGLFPMPALAGAAAAVFLMVVVWSLIDRQSDSELAEIKSDTFSFSMPSMPSRPASATKVTINPGAVQQRIRALERKVGPSLNRHIRIPERPKSTKPIIKKETSMLETKRA